MRKQNVTPYHSRRVFVFLLFLLISVSCFSRNLVTGKTVSAAALKTTEKKKNGLLEENGKIYYYKNGKTVKNTWMKLKVSSSGKTVSRTYYFQGDGSACTSILKLGNVYYCFSQSGGLYHYKTNRLITKGKYQYCPDSKGRCQTGWLIINKKLYHANVKGRIQHDKVIKGITLGSDGSAVSGSSLDLKLKKQSAMILAQITTPAMTKSEKLKACWNYMVSSRFRYSSMSPNLKEKDWQKKFAYNMLVTGRGSCTSYACGFAALASAIGYDPVVVYGRVPGSRDRASDGFTRHCWIKINGKYYDPEAHALSWRRNIYQLSGYPIRHQITKIINFETGV